MPLVLGMLFGVGAIAAVLLGAGVVVALERMRARILRGLLAFAAGSLLGAALLGLLPEATEGLSPMAVSGLMLSGILAFFLLEKWVLWRHCHEPDCEIHTASGYLILAGDSVHNAVDGLALGAALAADVRLGIVVGLAILAHEIPQEVGDFVILVESGLSRARALAYNIASEATIFPGLVAGYLVVGAVEPAVAVALAVTAGGFLYIALADLIPDLHRRDGAGALGHQLAPLLAGVALMWGIGQLGA